MADTDLMFPEESESKELAVLEALKRYLEPRIEEPKRQIAEIGGRVDKIELRLENEELTRTQARSIQRAAAKKAYAFAEQLADTKAQQFANIYGGLKDRYDVPTYTAIPRNKFMEALQIIAAYDGSGRSWWRE